MSAWALNVLGMTYNPGVRHLEHLLVVALLVSCGGNDASEPSSNPLPVLLSVSPADLLLDAGPTTVTLTGGGFISASRARFNGTDRVTRFQTEQTLSVELLAQDLATSGSASLTVVNGPPGGGTSGAAEVRINYPLPHVNSVTPDRTPVQSGPAEAVRVTITGTGFTRMSQPMLGAGALVPLAVTSTQIVTNVTWDYRTFPGSLPLKVVNPAPGGGESNSVNFDVLYAVPVLAAIAPDSAVTGSGFFLRVDGSGFGPGSVIRWKGTDLQTGYSGIAVLSASVPASLVQEAGDAPVQVFNPAPGGGTSNILTVRVREPPLAITKVIALTHNDIAWDGTRSVIYASVGSVSPEHTNSVVRINPATGAITGTVLVGSDPGALAITEDFQYLYVALKGATRIARVALATLTLDLNIDLPDEVFFGPRYAEDIVPIPGSPRTFAVSTFYTGVSPRNAGTYLFDDATARPVRAPVHTGSNLITRGPTATRIYGFNNESTEWGFRSLTVLADGLHEETVKGNLLQGWVTDIQYDGGFVYSTSGDVIEVPTMLKVGTIPAQGVVRPDGANGRVHFLREDGTISAYHNTVFNPLGSFQAQALAGRTRLIRWGTDGLAAGGGEIIVLLQGRLVAP